MEAHEHNQGATASQEREAILEQLAQIDREIARLEEEVNQLQEQLTPASDSRRRVA
jgi:hypothetical protein